METLRTCRVCGIEKEYSAFPLNHFTKNGGGGARRICKCCYKQYYRDNLSTINGRLRAILMNSKSSAKVRGYEWDLSFDYLLYLFNKQEGRCALSGEQLILKTSPRGTPDYKYIISIDRINNGIGYVEGNIQFVTTQVNVAKNSYSTQEFLEMCIKVVNHV